MARLGLGVTVAGVGLGLLMWLLSPDSIPDGVRVALLLFSGAVVLFGLAIAAWETGPVLRLRRSLGFSEYPTRIPMLELIDAAERRHGLDVENDAMVTFMATLRQAGVDGVVEFFGRRRADLVESQFYRTPLVRVPPSHLAEYWLDTGAAIEARDNLYAQTYNPGRAGWGAAEEYRDLHVDRVDALKWLKRWAGENATSRRGFFSSAGKPWPSA